MYAAFMDFTQAYDTVDRTALWEHLGRLQLPPYLLAATQALYENDSYTLVDGHKQTPPIHPTRGVKQGCPLSPLLFSLFINDFKVSRSQCGVRWMHPEDSFISHLFYADDLVLLSTSPAELNEMLQELRDYAQRKGLNVNIPKSEVVVFNSPTPSTPAPDEVFRFDGQRLQVSASFKYLGLRLHSDGLMKHADSQSAKGYYAALGNVMRIASTHGVKDRLDLVLRLYQSYALPLGLYASQVWSTGFLDPRSPLGTETQQHALTLLRHLSWVRRGTDRLTLLAEVGQRPLQFYWWRSVLNFWNHSVAAQDNPVMTQALRSDLRLAKENCIYCWTAEVRAATAALTVPPSEDSPTTPSPPLPPPFATVAKVDAGELLGQIWHTYEDAWGVRAQDGFVREEEVAHRPRMTYASCFRLPAGPPDEALPLPAYLSSHDKHDVRRMAGFRLGSHQLGVARGRFRDPPVPWKERICTRCSGDHLAGLACKVDDEHHMIFDCEAFNDLRIEYHSLFENTTTVRDFFSDDNDDDAVQSFILDCLQLVDESLDAEQP